MKTPRPEVVVVRSPDDLALEGARRTRTAIREAVQARGRCTVSLAGGRTPRGVYEVLSRAPASADEAIDWTAVHLYFGDERHVPPEHADSNYRMVLESLVSRVPVPAGQVHRMRTEQADAASVAADYERQLAGHFSLGPHEWPRFDLVLLGMGSDGHTASLFPGTPVLEEREHLASAVWVASLQTSRVTLTYPVFNRARLVIVLVSGVEKAETLHAVLEGPSNPEQLPVQGIHPRPGRLVWIVDEGAAARLGADVRSTPSMS
jgi:6-phosphogluconolactonase